MMTENQILQEAAFLIKQREGFAPVSFWDNHQYTWGYGTKAPKGGLSITKADAEKEMLSYLKTEYGAFKKAMPKLANDPVAVPLLSKGYQYGSGIFQSLSKYQNDKHKLIQEAFYVNEQFTVRRAAEMAYYKMLTVKYGSGQTKVFAALLLVASIYTIYYVTRRLKH